MRGQLVGLAGALLAPPAFTLMAFDDAVRIHDDGRGHPGGGNRLGCSAQRAQNGRTFDTARVNLSAGDLVDVAAVCHASSDRRRAGGPACASMR